MLVCSSIWTHQLPNTGICPSSVSCSHTGSVLAINARQIIVQDGTPSNTIGWGGSITRGGYVMVVDNSFHQLENSFEQNVGHKLGHVLGLPHRASTHALMNNFTTDNDGDASTWLTKVAI
jgi:hypothetical protein